MIHDAQVAESLFDVALLLGNIKPHLANAPAGSDVASLQAPLARLETKFNQVVFDDIRRTLLENAGDHTEILQAWLTKAEKDLKARKLGLLDFLNALKAAAAPPKVQPPVGGEQVMLDEYINRYKVRDGIKARLAGAWGAVETLLQKPARAMPLPDGLAILYKEYQAVAKLVTAARNLTDDEKAAREAGTLDPARAAQADAAKSLYRTQTATGGALLSFLTVDDRNRNYLFTEATLNDFKRILSTHSASSSLSSDEELNDTQRDEVFAALDALLNMPQHFDLDLNTAIILAQGEAGIIALSNTWSTLKKPVIAEILTPLSRRLDQLKALIESARQNLKGKKAATDKENLSKYEATLWQYAKQLSTVHESVKGLQKALASEAPKDALGGMLGEVRAGLGEMNETTAKHAMEVHLHLRTILAHLNKVKTYLEANKGGVLEKVSSQDKKRKLKLFGGEEKKPKQQVKREKIDQLTEAFTAAAANMPEKDPTYNIMNSFYGSLSDRETAQLKDGDIVPWTLDHIAPQSLAAQNLAYLLRVSQNLKANLSDASDKVNRSLLDRIIENSQALLTQDVMHASFEKLFDFSNKGGQMGHKEALQWLLTPLVVNRLQSPNPTPIKLDSGASLEEQILHPDRLKKIDAALRKEAKKTPKHDPAKLNKKVDKTSVVKDAKKAASKPPLI